MFFQAEEDDDADDDSDDADDKSESKDDEAHVRIVSCLSFKQS